MPPNFHIEVAKLEEVPELAGLWTPAFADGALDILLGNIDTPAAIAASGERHQRAWREHMEETGNTCAIKCIYTDPQTGNTTLASAAEWYIFDKPRSPENAQKWNYLHSGEWLADDQRAKANAAFRPVADARIKWTTGRAHAVLQFMVSDQCFRGQGAASLIIQWGVDRCKDLGIPAYLEAFETTRPFYEKFGFEQVDIVHVEIDDLEASFPAMMWWPPLMNSADKKPLGP